MAVKQFKSVDEILGSLDSETLQTVELLRRIILSAGELVAEHVKWNSPAYYYPGEMAAFDAKEYRRDIVVMNIRPGRVLLVFPTGAAIPGNLPVLEGSYTDGRRMITVKNAGEAEHKASAIREVVKKWLDQVDK